MSDFPWPSVAWSSVIKNSFYYSEYHAFQIEEVPEGLVLHGWSKNYDNTASDKGSLFLKPEWIVHLINMIRSVPKDVLRRGEGSDGEAYGGQWYREVSIPNAEPDGIQIRFSARNRYVERGSPKLCIRSYAIKPKTDGSEDMDCFIDYPLLKERRDIEISHGYDVEGYVRDVEPVLHELEKYVPEKDKDKNFIWYGHFGVDDKASPDAGEDFPLHFFINLSISIDGTRQTLINQFKIILSAILEYEETVIGIYKNIKVKVWENEKDSSKYSLELYDYDDDSITWQELEAAGFREYSSLRWYTVVPKEDVKILK